ncbi:MAG: CdaR family protein [Oscillospiraceae bacterium]|nr:CdaR family protein [Oscillospiraceae bacterium]
MENKNPSNKLKNSKVLYAVVSLIAAVLLWVYVTDNRGTNIDRTFYNVPVVYTGEENLRNSKEFVITSRESEHVKVTLSGPRRVITRLDEGDLAAMVDLSSVGKAGDYSLGYSIAYPSGVDKSEISVSSRFPESVAFYVDKLVSKYIDVTGIFNGSMAPGYVIEPLEFSPSTVKITGTSAELADVKYAYVTVERSDVDKTVSFDTDYALMSAEGDIIDNDNIERAEETVSVTLPVLATKEIPLTVNLIAGGGASEINVISTISPSPTVTLSGDSDVLSGVNRLVLDSIDLSDIDGTFKKSYKLAIPNDTQIIKGTTDVTLELEIVGLVQKKVTVSAENISVTNLTEGYSVEIINDNIPNVVLRGRETALSAVADVNVRAVADLSQQGNVTGVFTLPVKIFVDGSADVGAVGDYSVTLKISEKTEETEETSDNP